MNLLTWRYKLLYCWEIYIWLKIKTIPSPGFVHKIFWRDP